MKIEFVDCDIDAEVAKNKCDALEKDCYKVTDQYDYTLVFSKGENEYEQKLIEEQHKKHMSYL